MVPQPTSFHRWVVMTVKRNQSLLPRKKIGSMPSQPRALFTMPLVGDRITRKMPPRMTHDRKWGM